jgi:putative effector of murein hydrolase LrgA (UPF0299 family)
MAVFLKSVGPGVLACVGLAMLGGLLAPLLGLPGPVLGLLGLVLCLARGPGAAWLRPGVLLLARWIGAALVPVLVGLVAHLDLLAGAALPLLFLLVATTLATALATAMIYRVLAK